MSILRKSRRQSSRRPYHLAAVAYIVLLLPVALLSLQPGMPAATSPGVQSTAVAAAIVVVTAIIVWSGRRKLTFLISLGVLYWALVLGLDGRGHHITPHVDTPLASWTQPKAWEKFATKELGTGTPFYEGSEVDPTAVIKLPPILAKARIPLQQPVSTLSFASAAAAALEVLLLWRAARRHVL